MINPTKQCQTAGSGGMEMDMSFLDEITKKAQGAVRKTKELNDVAKIKLEIAEQRRKMQKIYAQLGAKYYALRKESPDAELAELCGMIRDCHAAVESLQKCMESIKNTVKCPNCGAECSAEFPFCGLCGHQLTAETAASAESDKRRCRECGAEMREEAVFCTNCGAKNDPEEQDD